MQMPSHYLNQYWNVANWTLKNKLQWIFNRNSNIFIQENALENVVWKIAAILSRCAKTTNSEPGRMVCNRARIHDVLLSTLQHTVIFIVSYSLENKCAANKIET